MRISEVPAASMFKVEQKTRWEKWYAYKGKGDWTGSEIKPIGTSGPAKSPPERLYLSIKLYGFRYHKTIMLIFTVIRISNPVVLEEI
jgi:hypothetical protein